MKTFSAIILAAVAALTSFGPTEGSAGDMTGLSKVELRPGWRMADGSHMSALHIVLEPGWKTYWRAPGDVGIPPQFDWSGSENIDSVSTSWPTPEVFFEQGMRSVGYRSEVVIPLRMTTPNADATLRLEGKLQIGICKDICIPANLSFEASLPPSPTRPDPTIAAALTDVPYTAREAGVASVTCQFEAGEEGTLVLHTRIEMPSAGGEEYVVVEAGNPHVWVAEPDSRRDGAALYASTRLMHVEGKSFALNRSDMRFTVIGALHAVDIRGCASN
ncbi:protein-disulfide reductase DsbD domain-containing protein [Marivita hallyeonensis]|uniref:Thiol-disulfide interchange protein, contains DsbC and DsbD domains n=1 Tax=Marivita hallyeonensis TaxID=996342 RepID=A0A1M5TRF0_9RHOB|nr:protein-disulfide reductase DsbD domain-containing protein [Marivita hallyeonensis]SHH52973.1 Thiol-disulfide interchange protein, contains DsbC and DsbD domains [Marivita hallyeonensis]